MLSQTRQLRELTVRVAIRRRIELRDIFRHIGIENAVTLPDDEMRGVGRIHDVDGVDVAGIFLADTLKHALGAGALDAHGNARIFRLERFRQFLGDRQIDRRVVDDLAFLPGGLDQGGRDGFRGRRIGQNAGGERSSPEQAAGHLQRLPAGNSCVFHCLPDFILLAGLSRLNCGYFIPSTRSKSMFKSMHSIAGLDRAFAPKDQGELREREYAFDIRRHEHNGAQEGAACPCARSRLACLSGFSGERRPRAGLSRPTRCGSSSPSAPEDRPTLRRACSATRLQQDFKQPFVIENRPGAGSVIGTQEVANRRPTVTRCC